MTIEAAFVETLKLVKRLEDELREVKRNSSTLGIAVKKGREYTLSSDAFTAEYTYHVLTPQTGNTDDLSTINGGLEGRVIAIRTADAAYTITVKDGVGNIDLCGSDLDLDCEEKVLVLVFDENLDAWIQFGVGTPGAAGAADFLTLTDTPGSYAGQASKFVVVNGGESALEFVASGGSRLNLGSMANLTITGGAITLPSSGSFFNILAETGTADDLTDINGTFSDGDIIVIRPDSGDTITVLETGNIEASGTFTMDAPADKMTLIYDDATSMWCEIGSSGNA